MGLTIYSNSVYKPKQIIEDISPNLENGYSLEYNMDTGTYSYKIYSFSGELLEEAKNIYGNMYIENMGNDLLHIYLSAGTNVTQEWFVNRKTEKKSEVFENILAINGNTIAYMKLDDNNTFILVIRDIFDQSKLYHEIKRDFSPLATGDMIIENLRFINNYSIQIDYLQGIDQTLQSEIISW